MKDTNVVKTNSYRGDIPKYQRRWPGLFVRSSGQIVEASRKDQSVAKSYPEWPDKGELNDGMRITILTEKNIYIVNETIRVIHVFDAIKPGDEVYVMGPKPVFGEYVDDVLATEPPPDVDDPWIPTMYDGATLPSPAIDYNYDITSYNFASPGTHQIYWKLGRLKSNVVQLKIRQTPTKDS